MGRPLAASWFGLNGPTAEERAPGAVRAALNRIVFANTPPIEILVNPFAVLVAMAALGEAAPLAARIAFFAGSLVVVVCNSTIYYAFQRDSAKDARPIWWHAWLIFGAALNGLVWGLGSAATFPLPDPGFVAAFLPMLLAGFAGGYVASQSASLPSVVAFIWLAFTPLAVRLLLSGEALPAMTGGAMLFYGAILSLFSWTTARSLRETILLRIEKGLLVRAFERSAAKFEKITETLPGAVFEGHSPLHGDGAILHASRHFLCLFGLAPESDGDMLGTLVGRIHPADRTRLQPLLLGGTEATWSFTIRHRYDHPERGEIWVEAQIAAERADGGGVRWYGFARDCTEDRALEQRDRLLARVFETTTDGAFLTDPHLRIVTANAAFLALLGLREEQAIGRSAPRLLSADGATILGAVRAALAAGGSWRGEVVAARPDGGGIPVLLTLNVALGDDGRLENIVGVLSDITHLKATERRLAELAQHDDLTGLPNRRALGQRLEQAIAEAAAGGRAVAVHFVDLDGFKQVNDDHGHEIGDAVLAAVADRLRHLVRGEDAVFRFGGDEFVVLQRPLADAPADAAEQLAHRLVAAFSDPVGVAGGSRIEVGVSIGVAVYPADGTTAAELLRRADAGVYRVKHDGKRGYSLNHDNAPIGL